MRLLALYSFAEEKSLLYISDSLTYLQVANNVIHHGIFSMEIPAPLIDGSAATTSFIPHPDNFRTPLYPLFLIPFILLKTSLYVPVVVQSVILSAAMVLFYLLGRRLVPEPVAALATIALAFEPFGALIGAQIMTESLFLIWFILSVLYLLLAIKEHSPRYLLIGAGLLGLAAITRPVAFYLGILIIPIAALFMGLKTHWKKGLLAVTLFCLVASPWLYYNFFIIKTTEFSSLSSFDLYAYHGKYFDLWRASRGADPGDRLPFIDLNTVNATFDGRAIPLLKSTGLAYIKAHPIEYLWYHLLRLPALYTDSGYSSLLNGVPFLHLNFDSVTGGVFDGLVWSRPKTTLATLRHQPVLISLLGADLLFVIITLLAAAHPLIYFRRFRQWPRELLLVLALLIVYTGLASPIGGARLRIPVNFFLFLLAFHSLWLIRTQPTNLEKINSSV